MQLEDYLGMFLEESEENMAILNNQLLVLEANPGDSAAIQEIFRAAHTLKGMSATMGFQHMAELTHAMENALDWIRQGKAHIDSTWMDTLFAAVDELADALRGIAEEGQERPISPEIFERLKQLTAPIDQVRKEAEDHKDPATEAVNVDKKEALALNEMAATALPEQKNGQAPTFLTLSYEHWRDLYDTYQGALIQDALAQGMSALRIEVELDRKTLLKAARAYIVYQTLSSMGEVVQAAPSIDDLEAERFDLSFVLTVLTQENAERVRAELSRISEVARVDLYPLVMERKESALKMMSSDEARPSSPGSLTGTASSSPASSAGGIETTKAGTSKATNKSSLVKTLRVDAERLELLMNVFSELVIDRGRLLLLAEELGAPQLREVVERMSRTTGQMQDLILSIRMVSVETVFNRFPRMVRDIAKEVGKKVDFVIEGEETELDRTVIDELGDPLMHLLRNALDHGLELPDDRRREQKPETGKLRLAAYRSGHHVYIEVQDDGSGIDAEKVREKAVQRGLMSPDEAQRMSDQEIYQVLFLPGFSTRETVSELSGRGVGLDVVKTKIESLGGRISVHSKRGSGTLFRIQLPLSLSILTAMLFVIGEETYALPLGDVVEAVNLTAQDIKTAGKKPVFILRGRILPLVDGRRFFGLPQAANKHTQLTVLVLRNGEDRLGLVIDRILGQQEIVLKGLGSYLKHIQGFSGATILGDGRIALVIDTRTFFEKKFTTLHVEEAEAYV